MRPPSIARSLGRVLGKDSDDGPPPVPIPIPIPVPAPIPNPNPQAGHARGGGGGGGSPGPEPPRLRPRRGDGQTVRSAAWYLPPPPPPASPATPPPPPHAGHRRPGSSPPHITRLLSVGLRRSRQRWALPFSVLALPLRGSGLVVTTNQYLSWVCLCSHQIVCGDLVICKLPIERACFAACVCTSPKVKKLL